MTTDRLDGVEHLFSGKVRETYAALCGHLLPVATNRISTHDKVHLTEIPFKGEVLTMLTVHWLTGVLSDLPHHLVAWGSEIYRYLPSEFDERYPELRYRALVVRQLDMVPVEFIYRRYLAGSLLKHYKKRNDPYGLNLPPGLKEMHRFATFKFTPTTKSPDGDVPIRAAQVLRERDVEHALASCAFARLEEALAACGIAPIDFKAEVGWWNGLCYLADEVGTPDSCRFVDLSEIIEGQTPQWRDKQLVRGYVEGTCGGGPKRSLKLPQDLVQETSNMYLGLLPQITGLTHEAWRKKMYNHGR